MTPRRIAQVLRVVALVELLGASWGTLGFVGVFSRLTGGVQASWYSFVAFGFFALVGTAGVLLLRGRQLGVGLSLIAQLMQVVQVVAGPIAFRFQSGPQLTVWFLGHRVGAYAGILAAVTVSRTDASPTFALGLNLVPLACLLTLLILPSPDSTLSAVRPEGEPQTPAAA